MIEKLDKMNLIKLLIKHCKHFLPVLLIMLSSALFAQSPAAEKAIQDTINSLIKDISELQQQIKIKQERIKFLKQYIIGEKYNIGDKPTYAKVIKPTVMRSEPNKNSVSLGVKLNVNDTVLMYKYFPGNNCWAIKRNGLVGFVPMDAVMGISAPKEAATKEE